MSSVPVIVGGAAKDAVPSVIIGGVEKKIYDAYVMVGGAAKLLYKSAVEWTHSIVFGGTAGYTYGGDSANPYNLHTHSVYVAMAGGATSYISDCAYTFPEPLVLPPGSYIVYEMACSPDYTINYWIYVNDVLETTNNRDVYPAEPVTKTYSSGATISSIHIHHEGGNHSGDKFASVKITVHPADGDAFMLTFKDSSVL